ncbi:hypothetical protein B566_EDAN004731 [Ephemera danica]|nr:hypothetical protein B566_EDAN004731 [Ephemera danica]
MCSRVRGPRTPSSCCEVVIPDSQSFSAFSWRWCKTVIMPEKSDTELFLTIGLSEKKVQETLKNKQVSAHLKTAIIESGANGAEYGALLYHLASKMRNQIAQHLPLLARYVTAGKLDTTLRIDAALEFLIANAATGELNVTALEKACGVGEVITPEQIEEAVEKAVSAHKEGLLDKRYRYNVGLVMQGAKESLSRWVDGRALRSEVELQLLHLLGPKTADDLAPQAPEKKEKKAKQPSAQQESKPQKSQTSGEPLSMTEFLKTKVLLHKPGENYTSEGYVVTPNTQRLLQEHLKFPPEPNGILHIGHAKAININFGYAAAHNGVCFLRYDDTNPEKEEEKFFTGIRDMVEWLGYKPYKITHSSDYFDQLYAWAVQLVEAGLAYDMKNGKIDEGAATLRMKVTLEEGKQDPVAYRIKFVAHHRTGDKWCIYPTYDYTHCLCDSIEHITHSLCTKEFQSRRRGFPSQAINNFCAQMGLTGAQVMVDPQALEACVRDVLNLTAPRAMCVMEPLKVTITNFPHAGPVELSVPNFPSEPARGSHTITFAKELFIEASDFKQDPEKGYRRLAVGQSAGLRHAGVVLTVQKMTKDAAGQVTALEVTCVPATETEKPRAWLHWVANPLPIEVRLYESLFQHKNPEDANEVPGGFLSDCVRDSLRIVRALTDGSVRGAKVHDAFQFERVGFFAVDPDSRPDLLVFNRTVTLKEDTGRI